MSNEEFIDIYDDEGQNTGVVVPRDSFLKEGQYAYYALAVVEDLQGRYLITQRSLDKKWAGGWWEIQGGGVLSGETPVAAAIREVGEETGLNVEYAEMELLYGYKNVDLERGDNYFADIFRFRMDFTMDDVVLQDCEAIDGRIASWDEIVELDQQGIFLHFKRLQTALGK